MLEETDYVSVVSSPREIADTFVGDATYTEVKAYFVFHA